MLISNKLHSFRNFFLQRYEIFLPYFSSFINSLMVTPKTFAISSNTANVGC